MDYLKAFARRRPMYHLVIVILRLVEHYWMQHFNIFHLVEHYRMKYGDVFHLVNHYRMVHLDEFRPMDYEGVVFVVIRRPIDYLLVDTLRLVDDYVLATAFIAYRFVSVILRLADDDGMVCFNQFGLVDHHRMDYLHVFVSGYHLPMDYRDVFRLVHDFLIDYRDVFRVIYHLLVVANSFVFARN
jgi:hypothetical protein